MKKIALSLTCAILATTLALAADRGPSTPEERARAVKAAELLQTDPLSPATRSEREWGIMWLIQVPDISVSMCLLPKEPKKYTFRGELVAANMMSMASFIIQNPDKAKDNKALWKAGQEGLLKAYEMLVKQTPKAKNDFYENLLQQRSKDG